MIKTQNLTKVFTKKQPAAVDSVSFEVANGEIVGFVGLNGAGKTTTIRMAVGVSLPTSGTVTVDGNDIVQEKVRASRSLGWVPEFPNFEPNARAISLMQYFAGFYGIPGAEAKERSAELLKSVGLEGVEERKLRDYSQGMKKRFSLGASMLSDPQNFLFDEVLNGLDPEGIRFFRQLMLDFRKQGKAVLLSSHILSEVENIADKVIIIHKGKLVKTILSEELANLGGASLKLVVPGLDERALSYLKGLGDIRVEGETVFITGTDAEPAEVNAQLSKMGYSVSELGKHKQGLEDYFMKLIGEGGK